VEVKAGAKLRCSTCGVEVVVVKPPTGELRCCGAPLAPPEKAAKPAVAEAASPKDDAASAAGGSGGAP
jgi:hypothetical protein